MGLPALERAVVAALKMAGEAEADLADRILDRYLARFGDDADAKRAALRRLEQAMTDDQSDAEATNPLRTRR